MRRRGGGRWNTMTTGPLAERSPFRNGGRDGGRILRILVVVTVCMTVGIATDAHAGLDGYNKAMLSFNRWLLRHVLEPVGRGYNVVMPKWGQRRLTAFFANLDGPRDIVNSGLQLKMRRAGTHSGRLLVNSTIGLGGLFDVGLDWFGWDAPPETLDETLGTCRVPLGPYVILPVLGDSSPRHLVGTVGDGFLDPLSWFVPFYVNIGKYVLRGTNLLAGQMPSPRASQAEWDAYHRSRFDFPLYDIGRDNFIADEADRVAN